MKSILNLYAGLGGNRKLWDHTLETQGPGVNVTAVEYSEEIAAIYKDLYPQDTVVVGDAHQYLLDHFKEFDFIWASPPCQTHSSFRQNICVKFRGTPPVYPDMKLWQEIVFLQANCETKWVVENVKPYYQPLIPPTAMLERHYFWANFPISDKTFTSVKIRKAQIPDLQRYHGLDLSSYKISNKRQILRNCVHYDLGDHIYRCT